VRTKTNKGFTGLEIVGVMAVLGLVVMIAPKLNPFSSAADPANRRSATSGEEIVKIVKAAGEADREVIIERRDHSEVTDPKLTVGQRIGRFFAGLGTWSVAAILFAIFVLGLSPAAILAWSRHVWKKAFKNTVSAIRDTDEETYEKLKPKLAARHDKRDKRLVDVVKAELH
jgi:hypothetical protein